ncbi:MAG: hypothetical protein LBH95_06575 [Oscillospiraceae bacterium]|nr:hypothetical protein [Oscillospiraceae bacterium]
MFVVVIRVTFKIKPDTVVSAYLLSYGSSYFLYFIAGIPIGLAFAPFLGAEHTAEKIVEFSEPIYLLSYILVASVQFLMAYGFFKIRRFKKGFPFLFKKYTVVIALVAAGIVLALVSLFSAPRETYENSFLAFFPFIVGILIIGVGIFIWIRRGIKAFYKKWVRENNEELYRRELEEKEREIRRLTELCETVRAANHGMIHRQAAVERRVAEILERMAEPGIDAGLRGELAEALEDVRGLSREYGEKVGRVNTNKTLPSTNVKTADALFAHFAEKCADSGIDFTLKVNGSVVPMIEKAIARDRLETLIGDHLQDALIAVSAGGGTRNILAVIGEAGDCYEFSVHDSGIPFEADTLARLGAERVTTRAGEGGSGFGFMATFETMRECGASLIIRENKPGGAFSKSVTIRFDGGNRYIIKTHRPGGFPPSDRYTVVPQ